MTPQVQQAEEGGLGELGRDMFGLEGPGADEPARPSIRLEGVKARVDRIHVEGLGRTRDDVVRLTVDELFDATDFEDVIVRTHKVRNKLESMGCFRDIGVLIDVSSGPGATPEGLEVTFSVSEMSRIVGGVNTTVSENEGNLVLGARLPNVLGRGERLQAEYSMGYRSSSNFSVTAAKPYPYRPLAPVLSASVFQQSHEYPWSGYRLLDRGLLLDLSFNTSPATKHSVQWEGLVRDTAVLSKTTSFKVRESSVGNNIYDKGPVMKSGIRHVVAVDHRDDPIFPSRGTFVQFTSEVAGLGGGVAYLKNELAAQLNHTVVPDVVVSGGAALGVLHDVHGAPLADRLFLGGPTTLRGFAQRGVGPHADKQATGGAVSTRSLPASAHCLGAEIAMTSDFSITQTSLSGNLP
ncbi:Sorting and assembly machinery component 50 homolog [Eumeta japonica]|uniref:Sorting and assembly machinery component 50 homolog n=1 Tax=Eumeta variegata TaxID=151549 RepID=A0A4C1X0S9_EUMVA|nr:Sorting and assembly machinery component 50 homolog [Eumeta japonica]